MAPLNVPNRSPSMPSSNDSALENRDFDRRLGKARDLLHDAHHRPRHGVLSLLALVAAGVSATLLFTLVFGVEERPAQAGTKAGTTPAAFELSATALSQSASAPEVAPKPAQPLLVGTER